ncbi:hypothetical protein JTB14_020256 [Gonioctena quinquepunctata]|nr:hypothetical protein JTB14_020256 [Gonioctena quinquepunctata]
MVCSSTKSIGCLEKDLAMRLIPRLQYMDVHGRAVFVYPFLGMISSTLLKQYLLYINRHTCLQKLRCIQWMNRKALPKEAYCPTPVEHVANIITHGIWIIPSVFGMMELVNRSKDVSTSFHCVFYCNKYRQLKDVLHRCDRAMIYIFIAGSYFPWLTLEQLPHEGWASKMRWIVWFLAIIGITYQQIFHEKYKMLEIIFYVVMGVGPVFPILAEHYFMGMKELSTGVCITTVMMQILVCTSMACGLSLAL